MGNLVASLIAAEYLVTTEAKAKALRPVAEKVITAGGQGRGGPPARTWWPSSVTRTWPHKLFDEIGPRYAERPGGYTRILKLGNRPGRQRPDGPHRTGVSSAPASGGSDDRRPSRWRLTVAYDGSGFHGFAANDGPAHGGRRAGRGPRAGSPGSRSP